LWGWTFEAAFAGTELDADYWLIKSGGTSIGGLQRAATSTEPHAGVRLYLEVGDLEGTLARVAPLGGRVERDRVALGGADRWFAVVRGPERYLVRPVDPAPGQRLRDHGRLARPRS
jgi:predicted enzyme related to lactoylglutathione lyase